MTAAATAVPEVKRSLPGWSLARDSPRPAKKQGWQCPVPTVEDWADYKAWKEQQERKDELPPATQVFLADTGLLSYQDPDVKLPWIHRLKCELPRRAGRLAGDLPVKASYVAFGAEDNGASTYEAFKGFMAEIGVVLCRRIQNPPTRFELAHLEQSDLIFVADGDRYRLWRELGTDLAGNTVAEYIKWRYLQGALVVAVGAAMSLLGEKSWYVSKDTPIPFTGWKIFPHIVAPEQEGQDLEDLVMSLGGAKIVILGISQGAGMVFNKDGLVEPVRSWMSEYRWDYRDDSVKTALLIGPPRGTGLLCPLYTAMKETGLGDDEAIDVFSFCLTQEEEAEEERLIEAFDTNSLWLGVVDKATINELKEQGNEAFKAGRVDAAGISYGQAVTLAKSHAKHWSEMDDEARRELADVTEDGTGKQWKDDHRLSSVLVPLLLNVCVSRLKAYEQDHKKITPALDMPSDEKEQQSDAPMETSTMLVEIRDNLVEAFRAANDALRISGGQLAKAWYRRACVFEKMSDPRNAVLDLEESLRRAPGDKTVIKKRDEMMASAGQVAENMYYARHKELDAQQNRLKLDSCRALYLRGAMDDVYKDDAGYYSFSRAQPLARVVEGKLQELDGLPEFEPRDGGNDARLPYLHSHALWTWEFLVQRAQDMQLLEIHDVDLGSGPLEWLCKGLRSHKEVKTLRLVGVHLGTAGAKMLRNVFAQNTSLFNVALDKCAIHDMGLDDIATGLGECTGPLESLSLRGNYLTSRKVPKLTQALLTPEGGLSLAQLDLSENPISALGAKELASFVGAEGLQLRTLRLQDCNLDIAAFWRLVGNLRDDNGLSTLDLRRNPIGRGTRRCWRGQMGPTLRCEVVLSDHPLKARKESQVANAEDSACSVPLPRHWV